MISPTKQGPITASVHRNRALGRKEWLQPGAAVVFSPRSVERGRQEVCSVGPGLCRSYRFHRDIINTYICVYDCICIYVCWLC